MPCRSSGTTGQRRVQNADIAALPRRKASTAAEAFVGNQNGDAKAALAGAARTVEAVYGFPYQHHVTMEPMNATALWTENKCEVWTATQNAEAALAPHVQASGLPIEKCEVYRHHLGGGFGRRGHARLRALRGADREADAGRADQEIWSREEDMTHGTYHPSTQCKLVGGLDATAT